jgi:hypothetical protein
MAARSVSTDTVVTRDGGGRRRKRPRLAAAAVALTALLVALPAHAKEKTTHLLTLTDVTTEPAPTGAATREPACLLRFSLRRLAKKAWKPTADLTLEFADPREGRSGSLVGAVRLDLDGDGRDRRTMRIDGIDCDGLRPLNLHLACTTDDGRCPAGTRIGLKNFDRLEIAEDVLAFD